MSMGDQPAARRFGAIQGRTEVIETKVRTIYPDGSVVDSEPSTRPSGVTWAALADMFAGMHTPPGTRRVQMTRRVTTIADPWVEVPAQAEPEVTEQ